MELGFLTPRWLMVHAISLAGAILLAFLWLKSGPDSPFYGLLVAAWTLNLGLVVTPLARRLPAGWFHVPAAERTIHRWLGVAAFGRLLDLSGWNRHVAVPWRAVGARRADLPRLHLAMRMTAGSHGIAFLVHVLLATLAFSLGQGAGALWILLSGIAAHLYPVLLQRSLMFRLQPLLNASRPSAGSDD